MKKARIFRGAPDRRRFAPAVAVAVIAAPAAALAECPPPRSEAQHIAAGAVVFTGKVKAVGPTGRMPFPDYADFDVVDGPERAIRVYTPGAGLYTAIFRVGEIRRVVAYRSERGLETHLCLHTRP